MTASFPVILVSSLAAALFIMRLTTTQVRAYRIYRTHKNRPILMETDLLSRCPGKLDWNGGYIFRNAMTHRTTPMSAADVCNSFLREISDAELKSRLQDMPEFLNPIKKQKATNERAAA